MQPRISWSAPLLAAALVLTTIAGCAPLQGDPPKAVKIPDDCDRLATPLAYPSIVHNEDLGVRSAKWAAWGQQNAARLRAYKACNIKVRAAFR